MTTLSNEAELGNPAPMIFDVELKYPGFNRWVENRGMSQPLNDPTATVATSVLVRVAA